MSNVLAAMYPSATPPAETPAAASQPPTAAESTPAAAISAAAASARPAASSEPAAPAQSKAADAAPAAGIDWDAITSAVKADDTAPESAGGYADVMKAPKGVMLAEADELTQIQDAMHEAGVSTSQAKAGFDLAIAIARSGKPLDVTHEQGSAQMIAAHGDKAPAIVESARAAYEAMSKHWPGMHDFLEVTRLGNEPKFIEMLSRIDPKRASSAVRALKSLYPSAYTARTTR